MVPSKIIHVFTLKQKCGGHFNKEPSGCHSIELVFSEEITSIEEIDSDLFKAEYIEECIKCGDLLDLEEFRLVLHNSYDQKQNNFK